MFSTILIGCDSISPPDAALLEIRSNSSAVAVKATLQVRAVAYDGDGVQVPTGSVTWLSDHPNVATIDAEGRVTGQSLGSALIRARAGGLEAALPITVAPARVIVELNSGASILLPSEELVLKASLFDAEGQPITQVAPVTWQSGMPVVATVESGSARTARVKALISGMTWISATVSDVSGDYVVAIVPERVSSSGISVAQFQVVESGGVGQIPWIYSPELQVAVSSPAGIHLHRFEILVPGIRRAAPICLTTEQQLFSGSHGLLGADNAGLFHFGVHSSTRVPFGEAAASLTFTENGQVKTIAMRGQMTGQRLSSGFLTTYFWEDCN